MTPISDSDIQKAVDELGPNELQHLFRNLGISQRDIEHAEVSADTKDTRLKAGAVLRWWKKTKGKDATREVLLKAKRNISEGKGIGNFFLLRFSKKWTFRKDILSESRTVFRITFFTHNKQEQSTLILKG